jgi:hypothetical protein
MRRAERGNRILKFVFFRSTFCALRYYEASQTFYRRKRSEGPHPGGDGAGPPEGERDWGDAAERATLRRAAF